MKKYECIVFMQLTQDVEEAENVFAHGGETGLFNYLTQWDCGDNDPSAEIEPWGKGSNLYYNGPYVVSYNFSIGVCALYKEA